MTQEIIVYLIGAGVVVYIAVSIWRAATRRRNPCSSCGMRGGCKMKR